MSKNRGSSDGTDGRIPAERGVPTPITPERSDEQVLIDTRTSYVADGKRRPAPGSDLPVGFRVGRYRIEGELGRGGCSTVYRARRARDPGPVAIKVMHPAMAASPEHVQRFFQEAHTVQMLRHPDIVAIESGGYLANDRPYLIMELIEGPSLAELIESRGRLPPAEALEILTPVCRALAEIHRIGVIHRDIKASNIMIVEGGDRRSVKILDFGIAKLLDWDVKSVQTSIGVVVGSLHSLAPEQLRGAPVDARTDVYGLGVLLFHMLTGRYPFLSDNEVSLAQMHMRSRPPAPSALAPVPPAVDEVVQRAMAKKPAMRFESALALLAAFERAVTGPRSDERTDLAWAIYVEGRVEADDDVDDAVVDDMLGVVDGAAYALEEAGFQVVLQTNQAVLAASLTLDDPGAQRDRPGAQRDRVLAVARDVRAAIEGRPGADRRVHVNLCIHRDLATVEGRGRTADITGGAVADVDRWAPELNLPGIHATLAALDRPDPNTGDAASRYVRVDEYDAGPGSE